MRPGDHWRRSALHCHRPAEMAHCSSVRLAGPGSPLAMARPSGRPRAPSSACEVRWAGQGPAGPGQGRHGRPSRLPRRRVAQGSFGLRFRLPGTAPSAPREAHAGSRSWPRASCGLRKALGFIVISRGSTGEKWPSRAEAPRQPPHLHAASSLRHSQLPQRGRMKLQRIDRGPGPSQPHPAPECC